MSKATPRRKDVRLCISFEGTLHGLLWMSFLPKGGVSVGFPDKAFLVPALTSGQNGLETEEASILDLERIYGRESIINPHFTLHPPGYFHLKSENGVVLCEALVWTDPGPGQTISPWLRFVSNPIAELQPFKQPPHGRSVQIFALSSPIKDCSVAVHVDFVSTPVPTHIDAVKVAECFSWGDVIIRVQAFCVPSQPATLGYEITG